MKLKSSIEAMPTHVAIIADGNRRWAKQQGFIATVGHEVAGEGAHLREIFKEAKGLGIKYVSLWGFSTENWKRDKLEVNALFNVMRKAIINLRKDAHENKSCVKHIGRKDRLPKDLMGEIETLEKETKEYNELYVILCIDYGGRDEIIRAFNKILKENKVDLNEDNFKNYLDTFEIPDPDLIIRTGGEQRTSGFMPYQSVYSEWYFTKTYFPAFGAKDLRKAVGVFLKRERRFGGNGK
jgi:undecaprenyl diphosphate synthase